MADETKKSDGPTCACGHGDLYEEWLKQNESGEKEEASTLTSQTDNQMSSTDTAGNGDTKPVQTKK
jgi:hypothetical protein